MQIILVDQNPAVIAAWRSVGLFDAYHGSIFTLPVDALVSPANSFGFMDGGIDLAYSKRFGWRVQDMVQARIKDGFGGELLIGQALSVTTGDPEFGFVIAAPTMRVPMIIPDPNHVRMATRAAIREAIRIGVNSIAIPGMGAGAGRVKPEWVACMMKAGIEDALKNQNFPSSLSAAMDEHYAAKPQG